MIPFKPDQLPPALRLQLAKAATKPKVKAKPSLRSPVQWQLPGVPEYVREYRFHPTRKWRFDLAWPELKLALEIDGGLYVNGGHSRGKAREGDYEKDAAAMALGWRVMRVSTGQLKSGLALLWIKAVMEVIK